MSKAIVHRVQVHFADCEPAGIVLSANFSHSIEQSSPSFFMACGAPPQFCRRSPLVPERLWSVPVPAVIRALRQ
jgi:acyl-CoA thioesterase FadM